MALPSPGETFSHYRILSRIGGGGMVGGRLMHGLIHPEMGHVRCLPSVAGAGVVRST